MLECFALKFYPLCVNLNGAKVVVIGAGRVAERKLKGLLDAGARPLVVAPQITPRIAGWAHHRQLRWTKRAFRDSDINGAKFVIAATDDAELNARIAQLAMRRKILVNAATGRATGDVILPAVARRGSLTIAISTGGRSPGLARRWREKIEQHFKIRTGHDD